MDGLSGRASDRCRRLVRPCASSLQGAGRRLRLPDVADKPESLAGNGSDQALFLAAIAERLAYRIDVTGQGRFRNDPAAPYRVQQVVLGDDVLALLHQVEEQVEDLRPHGNRFGPPGELAPLGIE